MSDRDAYIYECIADPDCSEWNCPTCGRSNGDLSGCGRCGFELDADRVEQAMAERPEGRRMISQHPQPLARGVR